MLNNILLITDSYKMTHWRQYPPGTQKVYSYLEARVGGEYPKTVFFGLQYLLKRYLAPTIRGNVVTLDKINQAEVFYKSHFGKGQEFNRAGWEYILQAHDGRLPICIKAVAEGSVVSEGNVLLTIENTDPACYWLTNYIETLLVQLWYPITVATISMEMKKLIKTALIKSSDNPDKSGLEFKLHDFGYRGVSSPESAAIGGAAHLLNFLGTDNLAACELLMDYYNADMPGFSIPAAEHSTITSWGRGNELQAYQNMLEQFPTGLVAVVSDSWDIHKATSNIWGGKLKDKVLARDGVLVVRPDSGDPKKLLPEILSLLYEAFGGTVNNKGFKILNPKVRLIQGDGIRRDTLSGILDAIMDNGWSIENIAFGSGGGLLQDCNRDTQRIAMKCSQVVVDGVAKDVYKQPATDPTKNSKHGRLMLSKQNKEYTTTTEGSLGCENLLKTVFLNGSIKKEHVLNNIIHLLAKES